MRLNRLFDKKQEKASFFPEDLDEEAKAYTKLNVELLGEAVLEVQQKFFPNLSSPIIAGGACRDMLFGLFPNDYDIFMYAAEEEESSETFMATEDYAMLFVERLTELLVEKYGERFTGRTPLMKLTKEPIHKYNNGKQVGFVGYEVSITTADGIPSPYQQGLPTRGDKLFACSYGNSVIQVLVKGDELLATDPLAWVEKDFDYNWVKTLYNPLTKEWQTSPSFYEKVIVAKGKKTAERARSFYRRLRSKYGEVSLSVETLKAPLFFAGEEVI